jgi:phosphomannomutase
MLETIFKAYDVRATYPDPLNEDAAWKVGCATGRFLQQTTDADGKAAHPDTVVVGRDMRPSSPTMAQACIEGLRAAGLNVIDLGEIDTSFIYFAVNHVGAVGGIQVTASHNPPNYNGLKISGREAKPIGATTGLKEIQAIAETLGGRGSIEPNGSLEERDLWEPYRAHVRKFLKPFARPLKVVIDASNGMAGKMVPKVFDGVTNLDIIPLNFDYQSGTFAHPPNPLVPANMKPTQKAVVENKADLGACFDGDADRCMLTDQRGDIIGCDHLTALFAKYFLAESPAQAIVYDLRSSKAVEETIRSLGGKPHRSRVGHVFLKAALRETKGVFGGELSGHFYFRGNFFADSGAIALAVTLSILGTSSSAMSELIAPFKRYPQSGEMNFIVSDKQAVIDALKKKFADTAEIDELDGVTIDAFKPAGWWFNVRASNTEPLLRLNAEGKTRPALDGILRQIKPMLGELAEGH